MSEDARPFYSRLLRLHYLGLREPVAFILFEGSIGVAALLVLAEIVSSWGLLAIPATVALMVKFNDVVAGALVRPVGIAYTSTPRFAGGVIVGRCPVPSPSLASTQISADDAVADPAVGPDHPPAARGRAPSIARGVAAVPSQDQPGQRWPSPGLHAPGPAGGSTDSAERGSGAVPLGADPTARRGRGNQGRFTT